MFLYRRGGPRSCVKSDERTRTGPRARTRTRTGDADGGRRTEDGGRGTRRSRANCQSAGRRAFPGESTGHHVGMLVLSEACCPTSRCTRRPAAPAASDRQRVGQRTQRRRSSGAEGACQSRVAVLLAVALPVVVSRPPSFVLRLPSSVFVRVWRARARARSGVSTLTHDTSS